MKECNHGAILHGTHCINCERDKAKGTIETPNPRVVTLADAGKEPDEGEVGYVRG